MSQSSFKVNMRTKKMPAILENLCQQADLIIGVGDHNKICFKRNAYVPKTSWLGYFQRRCDGDNPTDLIQRITKLKDQLFEQYAICQDQEFCDLILSVLLDLRGTCIRLRDTSYLGCVSATISFNSIIRSIDVGLPEEIRKRQGIPCIGFNLYNHTPFDNVVPVTEKEDKKQAPTVDSSATPKKSPREDNSEGTQTET